MFSAVNIYDKVFIMNGGTGWALSTIRTSTTIPYTSFPLVNVTARFDGQSWKAIDSKGVGQYYGETGTYVESQNKIYYWGGADAYRNVIAPASIRVLNYDNLQWEFTQTAALPEGASVRFQHTATMAGDNKIYYIGGCQGPPTFRNISMQDILVYDTVDGAWELRKSRGPPESVRDASALMGEIDENVTMLADDCYTYNTLQNEWTQQHLKGDLGPQMVYGHSAGHRPSTDLPGNASVGVAYSILDLNEMAWTDKYDASALNYVLPNSSTSINTNSTVPQATPTPSQGSSNTRIIVGVVVGCVGAVGDSVFVALAIAIYVYVHKRRTRYVDRSVSLKHETSGQDHSSSINEKEQSSTTENPNGVQDNHLLSMEQQKLDTLAVSAALRLQSPFVEKPFLQSMVFSKTDSQLSVVEKPDFVKDQLQPVKPDSITLEKEL
ncbi:hypothetical protein EC973_004471 [Apophysomyces ossiformis]|uniref:Kelch repeat protein n=1 Tax=Apophysomyces ossiformis TaxID=679940 RepID=A0A8H7BEM6_9FUNG|nr:hypothetical protein EC973_004471 [Apophysomyces ossiformis]